jgi:hypothetical protein
MPPKQTKKTTDNAAKNDPAESINNLSTIKKEWIDNVNEIVTIREKLVLLEKRNEELVNKIWEIMNKNPSEQVVIESVHKEEEKKSVKSKKVEVETEDSETKPKSKTTTKSKAKQEAKPEVEPEEDEKPLPIKKAVSAKKDTKETKEIKDKKDTKKPAAPAPAVKGKISAPSKGTPKPKTVDSDDEKPKPTINDDSSSDTEIDSLSSVSDESDASGGEDD